MAEQDMFHQLLSFLEAKFDNVGDWLVCRTAEWLAWYVVVSNSI